MCTVVTTRITRQRWQVTLCMQSYLACSRHQFSLFWVSCIPSSVCSGKDKTKLVVCRNVQATTSPLPSKSLGTVYFHLKKTVVHNVPRTAVRKSTVHSPSQFQSHSHAVKIQMISVCLSVCLPACLSACLFLSLSVSVSVCLSVCLPPPPPFSISHFARGWNLFYTQQTDM